MLKASLVIVCAHGYFGLPWKVNLSGGYSDEIGQCQALMNLEVDRRLMF